MYKKMIRITFITCFVLATQFVMAHHGEGGDHLRDYLLIYVPSAIVVLSIMYWAGKKIYSQLKD
ncbi:MAG: hypothetical protein ABEH43_06395 [Flavobacteriales bacterium]